MSNYTGNLKVDSDRKIRNSLNLLLLLLRMDCSLIKHIESNNIHY